MAEKLPSREECFRLLKEHNADENVLKHSILVNRIAIYLGGKLKQRGERIDLELLDRASLLHDLDKIKTLETGNHGDIGEEILAKIGCPGLGKLVKKHILTMVLKGGIKTWEEKVLQYADMRVNWDRIVPLGERYAYLMKGYSKYREMIERTKPILYALEKEIFERLGENPDDIRGMV